MNAPWDYHQGTSYHRRDLGGHTLDWSGQPEPFKDYPPERGIALPRVEKMSLDPLPSLLVSRQEVPNEAPFTREALARILFLAHTVTAVARSSGGAFAYRSVASAGALYPFEIYLALGHGEDLGPGIYHHRALDHRLTLLRRGDPTKELARRLDPGPDGPPALVFFLTAIFFRSSWKYRDRAYRYHLLDTGHLLENLTLALCLDRRRFRILCAFEDAAIASLLAVDPDREAPLAAVCVWTGGPCPGDGAQDLEPAAQDLLAFSRVSTREIPYPVITAIHGAGSLPSAQGPPMPWAPFDPGLQVTRWQALPGPGHDSPRLPLVEALGRRRSTRAFSRDPLPMDTFFGLMRGLCPEVCVRDKEDSMPPGPLGVGVLVSLVHGVPEGFYLLDRHRGRLGLVRPGLLTEAMAGACLDQTWLSRCGVHVLFLADFAALDGPQGARTYRSVMLEAGRLGQRLYLLATGEGIGCCGIGAFYDQEAADLLGLTGKGRLLYLVGIGTRRPRSR